jgi:hypothetical protein
MISTKTAMKSQSSDRKGALAEVSLPPSLPAGLGCLVMAIGLAATKWPLIINHDGPWPLMEGVETCMLVALSLLSFLGLRYPIKMLPILLFEIGWKLIWLSVIALPLLTADNMDPATLNVLYACIWVAIVPAVIPWHYAIRQYVIKQVTRGARYRSPPRPKSASRRSTWLSSSRAFGWQPVRWTYRPRGIQCHGIAAARNPALWAAHRADLVRIVVGAAGLARPQTRVVPQAIGRAPGGGRALLPPGPADGLSRPRLPPADPHLGHHPVSARSWRSGWSATCSRSA